LGTASGIPTKKRNNVSVALNVNDIFYLLDAGEQCAASILRNDIDYNKIRAIFISHMDVDHFAGIPMLIKSMILWAHRKSPLKLFVPEKAMGDVKNCLKMMYMLDEILEFQLEILPIREMSAYEDENISMTFHGNKHIKNRLLRNSLIIEKYPDIQLESFSFNIFTQTRKIVYSGDLALINEMDSFIDNTDILFSELAHFSPKCLFEYISSKNVKRTICLHLHPDLDDKEAEILATAEKYSINDLQIGHDGMFLNF
jgi:ribonuclease BN (tRNA processing enzyme)